MSVVYTYAIPADFTSLVTSFPQTTVLKDEIFAAGLTTIEFVNTDPANCYISFPSALVAGDIVILTATVAAHTGEPYPDPYTVVDSLVAGQSQVTWWARCASTGNLGLSGLAAVDGVTPVAGDVVLAKNQSTGSENGPYVAASGAWARVEGWVSGLVTPETVVNVSEGTSNSHRSFRVTNTGAITVGTTSVTFGIGSDGTAFHSNASLEIDNLSEKVTPVAADLLVIEDSAASGAKKKVQVSNLPKYLASSAPANVTKAAAVIGVATDAARADHKHDVSTAAAVAVGTANAEGSSTSLARADHTHQVTGLTISGQAQGDVLYFNGTSWVRLAAGTSGQVLQTQGTGANPQWAYGKAASSDLNTGTDDAKFATSLALEGSKYLDQDGSKLYAVATGTDTYAITLSPAPTAYAAGNTYLVKFTNANTGAVTINVNALGAKSIVKGASTALVAGDIPAGRVALLVYDGTNFLLDFIETTAFHSNVSGEINGLTDKATLASADLFVIEDSAASNVKKKASLSAIVAAAFGGGYQNVYTAARATTTSASMQDFATLTTPALTGTYRVQWICLVDAQTNNKVVEAQLYNATDAVVVGIAQPIQTARTADKFPRNGIATVTFTGAAKTFRIQFRSVDGSTTVGCQEGWIEIWKI